MKRLLPDSIAGWLIVVLISGLALGQIATLAVHYRTRSSTLTVLEHFRLAERMADVVRLVGAAPATQRPQLIAALTGSTLRVSWGSAPSVADVRPADWRAKLFSSVVQSALWDVPWRELRVVYGAVPAVDRATAPPRIASERPRDRTTSLGRSIDEILAQHARVPSLHIALQLDDSSWLNFEAPFVESPDLASPWQWPLLALAVLLIVGLSLWSVRRLTEPLETLAHAAEQLGRDVNAPPLPESGPRELRQAAYAFNLMQARLQRFVQDRTQMTAAMSHDLRTPITRLRLRAEFVEDEEQRHKMLEDLDAMEAMVNATLAFAREESSTEPATSVDLVSLLDTLCEDQPRVAFSRGPGVDARLPYFGRPVALRRCFANLIDNAVKYGGEARVHLEATPTSVRVLVDDDGPGIPEADRERVFAPFTRLEQSRNVETGGTGLGLTIARTIARSLGGDVTLANRPEGGLRVTVQLPR